MKKQPTPKTEWNRQIRAARKAELMLSALSALQSLLAVAFTYATRNVINYALAGGPLFLWLVILISIAVSIPVLNGLTSAAAQRINDRIAANLRRILLSALKRKDYKSLSQIHSGALLNQLTADIFVVVSRYTNIIPAAFALAVQLASAIALLILLRVELAAIVCILGITIVLFGLIFRRMLKPHFRKTKIAQDSLYACFQENLEQMETLRVIADEDEELRRVDLHQDRFLRVRSSLRRLSVGGSSLFSLLVQIGTAALIIWGAVSMRDQSLLAGDLTAMLQLVTLFRAPISGLTGVQSQMAAVDASKERIRNLRNLPDEEATPLPDDIRLDAIVLDKMTFSYPNEEKPVFENFSARIDLTKWTCLSGISGRGKSTLYRLILGLYQPQSGRIYFETNHGKKPCNAASRSLFGYVPQSPILFSGTIRENLLLSCPDATEEMLCSALRAAQCEFVFAAPQGLDTNLMQFGEGLSIGQRQRIAVARAILAHHPYLLLDEITSSLDRKTAEAMLCAIAQSYPSVIIATHHPDALQKIEYDTLSLIRAENQEGL